LWDEVCSQIFAGTERETNQIIKFEFSDLRRADVSNALLDNCACRKLCFIQCGTAYGDGEYCGTSGFHYGVDAGCLAAVPDYLIDPEKMKDTERLGKFFDFFDSIALHTDGKGTFLFSDANRTIEIIDTGDEE
jgi:hypothetical protein